MLLTFYKVEIKSKFCINHNKSLKLYFESQPFTQMKNMSYKKMSDEISFQNKVVHTNTGEMNVQKINHILSQFEESQRATRSTKTICSFSTFNFQSIYPQQIFLFMLATILTHGHFT